MLEDINLQKAVSRIKQRSERQDSLEDIVKIFVDSGVTVQLDNENNQILYGRRGTGKTHIFQYLMKIKQEEGVFALYIDARTLGSSTQFNDTSLPLNVRCASLFKDIMGPITNILLEIILNANYPENKMEDAYLLHENLSHAITVPHQAVQEKSRNVEVQSSNVEKSSSDLVLSKDPSLKLGGSADKTESAKVNSQFEITSTEKIIFPEIHHYLEKILEITNSKLFVFIDEWSSLPLELQPYLAEYLTKVIIPVQSITLKIAALEQRSEFYTNISDKRIGFELGADISASQDLDETYVYDKNPENLVKLYSKILYNHLALELGEDYLETNYQITPENLPSKLFTEKAVFQELSRSAEGVVRDLINVFTIAYFDAVKRSKPKIDKASILTGAQQWFEQDKQAAIDESMQKVLAKIIEEVIGKKKSRSFLVQKALEKNQMLRKLFDARLLHIIKKGYSDKINPGLRYNIYALDYGTYVDLVKTTRAPDPDFVNIESENDEFVVPFDDKRSIRRIILDEAILTSS